MNVVNLRKEKYTVYIGRPSIFGNPFTVREAGCAGQAVNLYNAWIRSEKPETLPVLKAIMALPDNAVLGCFCKPGPRHGDIIVKLHEELKEVKQ